MITSKDMFDPCDKKPILKFFSHVIRIKNNLGHDQKKKYSLKTW